MCSRPTHRGNKEVIRIGRRRPSRRELPTIPNAFRPTLETLEGRCLLSVSPEATSGALTALAASSLAFEPNVGQTDAQVRYRARGDGYALFLTDTDAVLRLGQADPSATPNANAVVDIGLAGSNPRPQITPLDPLASVTNYIGSDPSQTHARVGNYARVSYHDVYPGVDLVYYGTQGQLEYDFVVAAGADPNAIALNVQGADGLKIDDAGNLVIHTAAGDVVEHAPVVYQQTGGARQPVEGHYVLAQADASGAYQIHFEVGAYDHSQPLTIDPVLAYSTYFGGSLSSAGRGIAVDGNGNVYVTGYTDSGDLPVIKNLGYQQAFQGPEDDAYVLKLDPTGQPLWFTYLGGSATAGTSTQPPANPQDFGDAIAVDPQGEAIVVGETDQSRPTTDPNVPNTLPFPVTTGEQPPIISGRDGFVAKLTADGKNLVYAHYLPNARSGADVVADYGVSVATDAAGDAFVLSNSYLPTGTGFHTQVTKYGPVGTQLAAQDYGGDADTVGGGIAVDTSGKVYVAGWTAASDFATTVPTGVTKIGGADAFVLKIDLTPGVTAPLYAVRVGGSQGDAATAIAVDGSGDAYVTGSTSSTDFPTVDAFQSTLHAGTVNVPGYNGGPGAKLQGSTDAFVFKLDPSGANVVYSTYLGGTLDESGNGIAVDPNGDAFITGSTTSLDLPLASPLHIPGGYGDQYGGGLSDAFVAELNAGGSGLIYSTYLGGGNHTYINGAGGSSNPQVGNDVAQGIALDSRGNAWVTGSTGQPIFPRPETPYS